METIKDPQDFDGNPVKIVPTPAARGMDVLPAGIDDLSEKMLLISENLGGAPLTPSLLPKITVPSGGGRSFDIPTLDGVRSATSLELIVLAASKARAYWAEGMGEGDKLPSCTSANGVIGVGTPGGTCALCPLSAFGTAVDQKGRPSRGQACREFRTLLATTEEGSMVIFRVPPSSGLEWDRYALALATAGFALPSVITRVELESAVNDGGVQYSKAVFRKGGELPIEAASALRSSARIMSGREGGPLSLGSDLATTPAALAAGE